MHCGVEVDNFDLIYFLREICLIKMDRSFEMEWGGDGERRRG